MSTVGDSINAGNASWTFSGEVVNTFEDHISKSVPFYNQGHDLICQLSDFFIKNDSYCYELGSSTGILSHKLAEHAGIQKGKFIGIDCVKDMVDFARKTYKAENLGYVLEDVLTYEYEPADMFISYYLLQFIHPSLRQNLVNRIFETLRWGGAFICFEKVRAPDARFQDIATSLYSDFKLNNGYSAEEIVSKTRSLKGVLEPFSTRGNLEMLERAGFKDINPIFKYICFEGYLCIK